MVVAGDTAGVTAACLQTVLCIAELVPQAQQLLLKSRERERLWYSLWYNDGMGPDAE